MVFRSELDDRYALLQSDCCYDEPECWVGQREEILEQWRHLHRSLQSEWFLHDKLAASDPDFTELT